MFFSSGLFWILMGIIFVLVAVVVEFEVGILVPDVVAASSGDYCRKRSGFSSAYKEMDQQDQALQRLRKRASFSGLHPGIFIPFSTCLQSFRIRNPVVQKL